MRERVLLVSVCWLLVSMYMSVHISKSVKCYMCIMCLTMIMVCMLGYSDIVWTCVCVCVRV